jgi:hypothetical protein
VNWLIAGLLASGVANAGPFTHKTSQGELAEHQVDRSFGMPKGWLELGLAADSKTSRASRDASGERSAYANDTRWRYSRLWFEVRQGFSDRITIYGKVPWVLAELSPSLGSEVRTFAMGDAHTGLVVAPWKIKDADIAFRLDLKAPSGLEWPSGTAGGPDGITGFVTGTGITNLGGFLQSRYTLAGIVALRSHLGYIRKFPGIVGYVVQTDGFGNGWLNPGDEFVAGGELMGQLGKYVALSAGVDMSHRGIYRMGVSGDTITGRVMTDLPGGPATFTFLRGGLSVEPTDNLEISVHGARDLGGGDTRTFAQLGLEEFSPQPGLELGMGVACRW